jgi:hypothetical protein
MKQLYCVNVVAPVMVWAEDPDSARWIALEAFADIDVVPFQARPGEPVYKLEDPANPWHDAVPFNLRGDEWSVPCRQLTLFALQSQADQANDLHAAFNEMTQVQWQSFLAAFGYSPDATVDEVIRDRFPAMVLNEE